MLNIAVMVSGGGTNLQAIIDAIENKKIGQAKISVVISSKKSAYALKRAENHGIKSVVVDKETYQTQEKITDEIIKVLKAENIDLVVLAGYMTILEKKLIDEYKEQIINIHPSLIPKYCGKGFYGMKVHQAVIEAGEVESGATVHFVDDGVDTGRILKQEKVQVTKEDTPETLAKKVLVVEHKILVETIQRICNNNFTVK